jgi:hypothetical protein
MLLVVGTRVCAHLLWVPRSPLHNRLVGLGTMLDIVPPSPFEALRTMCAPPLLLICTLAGPAVVLEPISGRFVAPEKLGSSWVRDMALATRFLLHDTTILPQGA